MRITSDIIIGDNNMIAPGREGRLLEEIYENRYRPVEKEQVELIKTRVDWLGKFFRLDSPEHGEILPALNESLNSIETMNLDEEGLDYVIYRASIMPIVGKYRHSFAQDRDLRSIRGDETDDDGIVWDAQLIGEEMGFLLGAATSDKWFKAIQEQLQADESTLRGINDHPLTDRAATAMLFSRLVDYTNAARIRTGTRVAAPTENLFRTIAKKHNLDLNKMTRIGITIDRMSRFLRSAKRPSKGSKLEVCTIIPNNDSRSFLRLNR